jgi:transcriptional regulator with XRE-family HTH domain
MGTQEYGKVVAKNLRRIASDAGKTQAEIARDLQINKATVSSWMNGTRVPRMDKIDLLAHYFNVSRADIMESNSSSSKFTYYTNPETAAIAQQIYDDHNLHALFDAARDSDPAALKAAAAMLKTFKETNPDG